MKDENGRVIITEKLDFLVVTWASEKPFLFPSLYVSGRRKDVTLASSISLLRKVDLHDV